MTDAGRFAHGYINGDGQPTVALSINARANHDGAETPLLCASLILTPTEARQLIAGLERAIVESATVRVEMTS